jgi:hypothetical protein
LLPKSLRSDRCSLRLRIEDGPPWPPREDMPGRDCCGGLSWSDRPEKDFLNFKFKKINFQKINFQKINFQKI